MEWSDKLRANPKDDKLVFEPQVTLTSIIKLASLDNFRDEKFAVVPGSHGVSEFQLKTTKILFAGTF